mmetsp:Transcript_50265/g.76514  ORF Transcript_50265/g.76514 Transcript_50265/m.76514 type:complete len:123 (-) Transcript_50265:92-460(-)
MAIFPVCAIDIPTRKWCRRTMSIKNCQARSTVGRNRLQPNRSSGGSGSFALCAPSCCASHYGDGAIPSCAKKTTPHPRVQQQQQQPQQQQSKRLFRMKLYVIDDTKIQKKMRCQQLPYAGAR